MPDVRYFGMPGKKTSTPRLSHPMCMQPCDDGRGVPQQMISRVTVLGPKKPEQHDSSRSAKVRAEALKKQREALRT